MKSTPLPGRWTAQDILQEIEPLGRDSYKKVLLAHGVEEPLFGVKIEELKKIQRRIRKDYRLALDLYATGNYDAMYLAGLIADETRMTRRDLRQWVKTATRGALAGWTVAGVAAESAHGWDLGRTWIESGTDHVSAAGWATLSSLVSIKADTELELPALHHFLLRVARTIHQQPNRTRYQMNGFIIAAGTYVPDLTAAAIQAGKQMGTITVDMGKTACQVPDAESYIRKVQQRGTIGRKRKSARC